MLAFLVEYRIKSGLQREDFFSSLVEERISEKTLAEPGCVKYRFFYPANGENTLILYEAWESQEAQLAHKNTEQYRLLQQLKEVFIDGLQFDSL